ncbi:hypothetical protein J6590_016392 [Homalodisca vitripennis]|nr:hypothetical protein J6590_016392 [Homalodisca vitripennis]
MRKPQSGAPLLRGELYLKAITRWETDRKQFHKPPRTTYQVLLGTFTTLVQTTKDGIPLPCYCRTIKEEVFDSFILLITHYTERILLKDDDSVNMIPQVTMSRDQTYNPRRLYLVREGQTPLWRKVTVCTILLILMPGCNLHLLSFSARTHFETVPKDSHLGIPQNG